jgi:diguanylate cyclase (GGDEF)-like protein
MNIDKVKVLIVEDESIIAEDLADSLSSKNYEVVGIAASGLKAIALAKEKTPHLILMDVMLQGDMDGINTAEIIKETLKIPVIYLTAYADHQTLERVKATNPLGYVVKPFNEKNLHLTIEVALQKHLYDDVTKLPNQIFFNLRLQEMLTKISTLPQQPLIPIFICKLQDLQRIHSTLGLQQCHNLIQQVTERLINTYSNLALVARLDTNLLGLIGNPCLDGMELDSLTKEIVNNIKQPLLLDSYEVSVTNNIGIGVYPNDGATAEELIKNAQAAMYLAEKKGGDSYEFYKLHDNLEAIAQLALETKLRNALKNQEFQLYYQPQIDLKTNQIVGAEVLVRWRQGNIMIPPAQFIPLAESTGLIVPLGEWILQTACEQAQIWLNNGFASLRIAVNLSQRQFTQGNLSDLVRQVLTNTGLPASALELEVTETMVMENEAIALQMIEDWQKLGIKISIDDFGTGYSSLSYLHKIPFDVIKIDRSFVCNTMNNPKTAAITIAIIQLAHNLNLNVIAEGVETQQELDFLRQNECDQVQGFFFSPPVPAEQFTELLLKQQGQIISDNRIYHNSAVI